MHPSPSDYDGGLLGQLHIAMIRLDAKVDGISSRINEFNKTHDDHEGRLRALESRPHVSMSRFEALENEPRVTPGTVWKVVGLIVSVVAIVVPVLVAVSR